VRNEILNEIKLVVSELDGHAFTPNGYSKSTNNVRLFFFNKKIIVEDEIFFDVDFTKEYGVSLNSKLLNKGMTFREYVYNLIQKLEYEFTCNFKLKSTTAKHYFIWEQKVLKNKKNRHNGTIQAGNSAT
jgi:hypothetical protein